MSNKKLREKTIKQTFCERCGGHGQVSLDRDDFCPRCLGLGKIPLTAANVEIIRQHYPKRVPYLANAILITGEQK